MTEKGYLVRAQSLQQIFRLVNQHQGNWDAVNWNKYPTVPGMSY